MDLLNGKPVCFLSGNEFLPKKGITFANQVENFFVLQGSMANSPFGVVDLDNNGVQNSKQHGIGRIKAASFAAIKDVLEKGEIILPLGEYKVHGKKQITGMIAAPIQIDKEKYVCVVMVIANLEQKRLYVHESFLTKNLQEIVASNSVRGSNASSPQPQGDVAKVLQNYLIDKQNVENNNIKENKNMNKNKIRLTESQLHRVIKEAVNKILNEDFGGYYNHTLLQTGYNTQGKWLRSALNDLKYAIEENRGFDAIIKELTNIQSSMNNIRNSGDAEYSRKGYVDSHFGGGPSDRNEYLYGDYNLQKLSSNISSIIELLQEGRGREAYEWLQEVVQKNANQGE
jgi:hypothetical protein